MFKNKKFKKIFWREKSCKWIGLNNVQRVNICTFRAQRSWKDNNLINVNRINWTNRWKCWSVWHQHFLKYEWSQIDAWSLSLTWYSLWLSHTGRPFEIVCFIQRNWKLSYWKLSLANANRYWSSRCKILAFKHFIWWTKKKAFSGNCYDRKFKNCSFGWTKFWDGHNSKKNSLGNAEEK